MSNKNRWDFRFNRWQKCSTSQRKKRKKKEKKNALNRTAFTIFTISLHSYISPLITFSLCNHFEAALRPIIWKKQHVAARPRERKRESYFGKEGISSTEWYGTTIPRPYSGGVRQKKGQRVSAPLVLINLSSPHITASVLISVHQDNHLWFLVP